MNTIFFETAVVALDTRAGVVIALFDKSSQAQPEPACVAILRCDRPSARALKKALGSTLKSGKI